MTWSSPNAQVGMHDADTAMAGIFIPLVTPLLPSERADLPSLGRLIDYVLRNGAHGLWLLGTSGEFAGLPGHERRRVVEYAVAHVADRAPLVVNVGDGSTRLAIAHARHAMACGARLLTLTPPHYYPHTMDEVSAHFRAVKEAASAADLYVYNIPQTVKVRMTVQATVDLARDGTVAGIKDSQNDLQWVRQLMTSLREYGITDRFRTFVGTRSLIDASVAIGADGAIPATGNIATAECVQAYVAAVAADGPAARAAQERVLEFEALSAVARGGSANAATLAVMKHVLCLRGILSHPTMTAPLRNLAPAELDELTRRLRILEADIPTRANTS